MSKEVVTHQCAHCGKQETATCNVAHPTKEHAPHLWFTLLAETKPFFFCTYRCLWGHFNHGQGAITGGSGYVACPCGQRATDHRIAVADQHDGRSVSEQEIRMTFSVDVRPETISLPAAARCDYNQITVPPGHLPDLVIEHTGWKRTDMPDGSSVFEPLEDYP